MSLLLHGRPLIPHGNASAPHLCQRLRAPRHSLRVTRSKVTKSQAASTSQKATTEKAQQKPTPTEDTTHVPIKTGEPTDPAHVSNGKNSNGANIEVDSVLAKELSENGTLVV